MNPDSLCAEAAGFHRIGDLAGAERLYRQSLAADPVNFAARHLFGVLRYQQGHHAEALQWIESALKIHSDVPAALSNYGVVLEAMGRFDEALENFDRALAIDPRDAEALKHRGIALADLERFEEALASYDRALGVRPDDAPAWTNRGIALRELKRFDEAMASFDRAIRLDPGHALAHLNKGIAALLLGRFEEGLALLEWRKKVPNPDLSRSFPQTPWSGKEELAGKTVFVYVEQGLGDTIHFARYAALAQARGARVVLSVQDTLVCLMQGLIPPVEVIALRAPAPEFDYHISLPSLPLAFGTIPAITPYLRAEPERIEKWAARLGGHGFKVGISWQGDKFRKMDIGRSFPVRHLAALTQIPGVRLISLQKNAGTEQLRDLPPGMTVETLGTDFDSGPDAFIDTAAVIANLDLVITSDTAITHLAGALGRPTWVALKYVPDWRWLLDRPDSVWYPTMRLFRQPARGDWSGLFARMRGSLAALMDSK